MGLASVHTRACRGKSDHVVPDDLDLSEAHKAKRMVAREAAGWVIKMGDQGDPAALDEESPRLVHLVSADEGPVALLCQFPGSLQPERRQDPVVHLAHRLLRLGRGPSAHRTLLRDERDSQEDCREEAHRVRGTARRHRFERVGRGEREQAHTGGGINEIRRPA